MNDTTGESCWPKTMANPLLMVSRHYVHIYLLVWLPVTVSIEFQLYREHTARPTANRNKQIYKHTRKSVSSMRNLANLASMPYSLSSSPNASKGPVSNRTSIMPQNPNKLIYHQVMYIWFVLQIWPYLPLWRVTPSILHSATNFKAEKPFPSRKTEIYKHGGGRQPPVSNPLLEIMFI